MPRRSFGNIKKKKGRTGFIIRRTHRGVTWERKGGETSGVSSSGVIR